MNLTLTQVARILVAHGIPSDCPDLAEFVSEEFAGNRLFCRRNALFAWLGY